MAAGRSQETLAGRARISVDDLSHDLLQHLFRRLGIFVNGFTLEAASAVAGRDELDAFEVFDLVASLVGKSLVIAEPNGDSDAKRSREFTARSCE